jgi:hypothetical protein
MHADALRCNPPLKTDINPFPQPLVTSQWTLPLKDSTTLCPLAVETKPPVYEPGGLNHVHTKAVWTVTPFNLRGHLNSFEPGLHSETLFNATKQNKSRDHAPEGGAVCKQGRNSSPGWWAPWASQLSPEMSEKKCLFYKSPGWCILFWQLKLTDTVP